MKAPVGKRVQTAPEFPWSIRVSHDGYQTCNTLPQAQPSAAAWPRVAELRQSYRATLAQAFSGEKPWETVLAECLQIQQRIDAELRQP